jgi:anti-sigma factor RsiW
MECREVPEALAARAGGELQPERETALAAHVAGCAGCRDVVARERDWTGFMRARLGARAPASEELRLRIRTSLDAERVPWTARVFGSPWAPRLATAAVLAVVALGVVLLGGRGTPAVAQAAAERHVCHDPTPDGPLPPCCTELDVGVGDALGPSYGAVRVPDLASCGLHLVRATHCTFADDPVVYLAYADAAGGRFSLYISDHGVREFRLLRHETRNGVPQARHAVALPSAGGESAGRVEVVLWLHQGSVFTWVGPVGDSFESALARLQATP